MAQLLNEIEWDDPILPSVEDLPWEAEVKRKMGSVAECMRRISPNEWVRNTFLQWEISPAGKLPIRLVDISALVTAQENACRYCYGASRVQMKMLGYSEGLIGRIEQDAQLAELDEGDRIFVQFCRKLARSNPRPSTADRDVLLQWGYSAETINEIIFLIARHCFVQRVATFIAVPPEQRFERMAGGPLGKVVSLFGPIINSLRDRKNRKGQENREDAQLEAPAFQALVDALGDLPASGMLRDGLVGAFASNVLSRSIKVLIFGVVSRALGCEICPTEISRLMIEGGFTTKEIDEALTNLSSPKLSQNEIAILSWARDTVHYRPVNIQKRSRALIEIIGEDALLEAVGVAALANSVVRLALILE